MPETKREQSFYVVRKDGRKIVMTLDCLFGEDDDSTQECLNDLKEAFADGASFAILDAEEAFKSYGTCSCENTELDTNKLWCVNIPPEPDSGLFYPVPSLDIAQALTDRLKKEAKSRFKTNGDLIADSIYFEEWEGTLDDHTNYLKNHPDWWNHATFLDKKHQSETNHELEPIETAVVTQIVPTKIWAEKGFSGVVHIKIQHEGEKEPFDFVCINYDYKYTSNAHQQQLAFAILKIFGIADADCKIAPSQSNITESEKKFVSILEDALMKCASKFAEYERHHLNKGDDVKASANKAMIEMCNEAMSKSNILQMMS